MASYTFDAEWSTTFCAWFGGSGNNDGVKTCLVSACCPCIQYGWNSEKLGLETGAPFAGNCFTAGLLYCLLAYLGCHCFVHMGTRQAIRRKYNLKESPCNDCLTTCCCAPCALCQEHYQITGSHAHATAKPVY